MNRILLAFVLMVSPFAGVHASDRPNIVIIFTDDQGYADVGRFGAQGFTTPHLDRLASEGAIFRNFHVAQAVCSASRAALLTGCYPNRIGIHGALGPKSQTGLSDAELTLAELLKQRGYATAMFGKWHLGDAPQFLPTRHGFDEYFGLPYSNDMWPLHPDFVNLPPDSAQRKRGYPDLPLFENDQIRIEKVTGEDQSQLTTWYAERAVKFIEQHRTQPFFLYVAHSMPHVPLFVSDKFRGKSAQGLYGDVIMEIDWSVGQILDALKRSGIEENTWVIFTSDNGPWLSYGNHAGSAKPLREGKGTSWEGGTRVPCIMRWPGKIPAGTDTLDMLMTIDLLPTIAGRTGAALSTNRIDGLDVWPLISRQPGAKNPHASYWNYYASNQLQAVTSGDGRWKLLLPHTYRTMHGEEPGRDGSPGKYRNVRLEQPELYDLASDIGETNNVAAKYPDIVRRLEAEAEQARAELGDVLKGRKGSGLRSPGRVPAGAATTAKPDVETTLSCAQPSPEAMAQSAGVELPRLPWHVANVWWDFTGEIPNFESLEVDVTIDRDVPETYNLYIAPVGVANINKLQFYGGLQSNVNGWASRTNQTRVHPGKGAIFSRWSHDKETPIGLEHVREAGPDCLVESAGYEGEFASVRRPFAWTKGTYTYRIAKGASEVHEGKTNTWFTCSVKSADGKVLEVGSLRFEGTEFKFWARHSNFVEVYSTAKIPRPGIPKVNVTFSAPRINGVTPSLKRVSAYYPSKTGPASRDCAWVVPDGSGVRVEVGPIFVRDEKRRSHELKLATVPARPQP